MGLRTLTTWAVGAGAMAVATFACRQIVGIPDDPPQGPASTDSGAEGGFTYGQGDCATCVATSCGPQATACAGTPSCAALEACLSACGTAATCRAQCGVQHGLGNDGATPAFESCLAGSCATACGLTCGGLAAVFPPATATACESCIAGGSECASVTACAVDVECQAALRCRFSSHTPDVQQACPLVHDAGPTLGPVTVIPIAGSCSKECAWGADWSCVGKVDWPLPTLGPLALTAQIFNIAAANAPIVQATVKLCANTDLPCTDPSDTGTTGDAGIVTLHRPPVLGAGLYYLDVSSPEILPNLVFDVFPISMPLLTANAGAVSQEQLDAAAAEVSVTLDPALGTMLVTALDCRLGPAPNVQISLAPMGPSTRRFYLESPFPSTTATATDISGGALFFNVPVSPTLLKLTVTPKELDGGVSGTMQAFVRAGGTGIVYALPTP